MPPTMAAKTGIGSGISCPTHTDRRHDQHDHEGLAQRMGKGLAHDFGKTFIGHHAQAGR